MAPKAIIVLDGIDDDVLAAARLRAGQTVVAEPTAGGLLLRAPRAGEVAGGERVTAADVAAVLRRYPATIDRLCR